MTEPGTITIVPSVHFSPTHRRRVRETIREEAPDLVAVELGERRYDRIERNARPGADDLARELGPSTGATYATLQAIQRTVVRLFGLDPETTDMEAAIETAAELDTGVALIDDPIGETVDALSESVGLATLPRMILRMQRMGPAEYADQVELLTLPFRDIEHGDDVQPAIDQLRRLLPEVAEVLIDRRDRAMAERLDVLRREGYDVVAVVGAGHHNGIQRRLDDLERQEAAPGAAVPVRRSARQVTRVPIE
jgi:pheromone shutdown protein TraB